MSLFSKKVEYPFKKPRRHPSKKFNDQSKQHVHYLINLQRYTRHIPLTVVFVPVACPHFGNPHEEKGARETTYSSILNLDFCMHSTTSCQYYILHL